MKLWFDHCNLASYMSGDSAVKFGLGWYRHNKDHKWRGITVQFYLYFWLVNLNCVDNYKEYDKKINHRHKKKYPAL